MTKYAAQTNVPISKTKAEIEAIVERYGAAQFMSGWKDQHAVIGFTMAERQIRFIITLPDRKDARFTHVKDRYGHTKPRAENAAQNMWEQACRQKWRALLLVIKAKLEAVESEISTVENEFMANIVLPTGQLVGDWLRPQIAHSYETRDMPSMLPDYSGANT